MAPAVDIELQQDFFCGSPRWAQCRWDPIREPTKRQNVIFLERLRAPPSSCRGQLRSPGRGLVVGRIKHSAAVLMLRTRVLAEDKSSGHYPSSSLVMARSVVITSGGTAGMMMCGEGELVMEW